MLIKLKNKETLVIEDFVFNCSIGKEGTKSNKIEGDKSTPKGLFSLGKFYYRADKVKKPETSLNINTIKKDMGWCDDKTNKKNYNKLMKINKKIKHEKLYRLDNKYDFMIPILYNTNKRVLGKGSAIFIHLTKDYKGTDGCVALKKQDFLILLKLINPNTKIKII